jgi:hypothetical protein
MNNEPAVLTNALLALGTAVAALLAYLNEWTSETTTLVLAVISAAVALGGAWIRSKVTPVAKMVAEQGVTERGFHG